jgi:hypothetical protein
MSSVKSNHTYLVLYIDSIDFGKEKFTIGNHDAMVPVKPRLNTHFKVIRNSTIANKLLVCPFSNCMKKF